MHQNSTVHYNALIARAIGGIPDQRVTAVVHCAVVHCAEVHCAEVHCTGVNCVDVNRV